MFTDKITYEDFNGNEDTMDVYFNISKMEALSLESEFPGGLTNYLQSVIDSGDASKVLAAFKLIVKKTYGVKSEDGKRFVKSEEEFKKFEESPAYDEFMIKLINDEGYALDFILGALPNVDGLTREAVLKEIEGDKTLSA